MTDTDTNSQPSELTLCYVFAAPDAPPAAPLGLVRVNGRVDL